MTAPRIVPADEARVLREAATPGPWHDRDSAVEADSAPRDGVEDDGSGWTVCEYVTHTPDAALIAAAPDLAATVEALHAEVERLRDKAIRFDLDQAGIEQREAEAVELVELRDDKKILGYLHRELNDLFGWGDESVLHAVAHVRNAVLNLRADLATEKFLKDNAERLVRNDIVDLLEDKAELYAEETEWVAPASVWNEAVELVRWKAAP
jgi:hypothetical protein